MDTTCYQFTISQLIIFLPPIPQINKHKEAIKEECFDIFGYVWYISYMEEDVGKIKSDVEDGEGKK